MKFARIVLAAISFAAFVVQPAGAHAMPPDLSTAKALYAAASYEEALAALAKLDGEDGGQVEQYRALCLLALGRTTEARQSFERLVTRQPRYAIADADFSPRVVTMFHDVRKQLLPAAAKDLFAKAKASFEKKQYAPAAAQLKEMFALLADADMPKDAAGVGDLKLLGEGFLALSEAQVAAELKAAELRLPVAPTERASSPASALALAPPAPMSSGPRIYSANDKNVIAPVEVERAMPPWTPATVAEGNTSHTGVVVIVIDEKGGIESAAIPKSVSPSYDGLLLAAARKWQFKPARLNDQPVKYWVSYEVVLRVK